MLSTFNTLRSITALSILALFAAASAQAQHGWPIEPTNSEHPIGNSFGEFQEYGSGAYQHAGIDILETPMYQADGTEDTSAPWVRATVGGTVDYLGDSGAGSSNRYDGTTITDTGGIDYSYWHLQGGSYHADFVNHENNSTAVAAGDRIARLVRWHLGDFHHLHYEEQDGTDYPNPLANITPNPDPDPPEIHAIGFAQDNSNPWVDFQPAGTGACTEVSGAVDIAVQLRDRDDASSTLVGADTLWVYNIRWRACPDTNSTCAWQNTYAFDDMPASWGNESNASTAAYFSDRPPWDSDASYWATTWLYAVVTNFSGGVPNVVGNWDTTTIPDGAYTVSIEATDFAGNSSVYNTRLCVQNTTGCTTELTIRDASDDNGAIPYLGPNWWLSPDITANRGTPDEDHNINVGAANPIEVQVWNFGSCIVPAGTTYDVCLGWAPPSGSVAHPLPPAQLIDCQTETVPAGAWPVGTSRVTTFTWTPASASTPAGHHCLVAWVDTPNDTVLNTPAVNWDDNRAQQNITFQPASPGKPQYSSFWINPQKMIERRSLELTFSHSRAKATLREARLHVSPGLTVERIVGGHVIGGYKGEKPIDPCKLKPEELHRLLCLSWDETSELGYTRVIGGIDPSGRLRLDGIRPLPKPVRLTLEVWSEEDVREGEFADIDVVEYGMLPGHEEAGPVGGLTVRFEH